MKTSTATRAIELKTYVFRVDLEREEDRRWSAVIPALPGCATWGHTKEEAFESIQAAARAYVETLVEDGKPIPREPSVEVIDAPAVSVTI